ncbi:MAG: hypothetical protein ACLFT4_09090 [Bacteroidales bacterium]
MRLTKIDNIRFLYQDSLIFYNDIDIKIVNDEKPIVYIKSLSIWAKKNLNTSFGIDRKTL